MTRRYDILTGDTTTSGGTVEHGDSTDKVGLRSQAYEGDPVWCPACTSMGAIVCVGVRHSLKGLDGREAALSDDLCACRCQPAPRLVATEYHSFMDV